MTKTVLHFLCPRCCQPYRASAEHSGKRIKCRRCNALMLVLDPRDRNSLRLETVLAPESTSQNTQLLENT